MRLIEGGGKGRSEWRRNDEKDRNTYKSKKVKDGNIDWKGEETTMKANVR